MKKLICFKQAYRNIYVSYIIIHVFWNLLLLISLKANLWLLICLHLRHILTNSFSSSDYAYYLNKRVNKCTQHLDCGACIKHPDCAWCADPKWDNVMNGVQQSIDLINQKNNKSNSFSQPYEYTKEKSSKPRCDMKSW